MIIQHNMLAMNAARQLEIAQNTKVKRMERLSSGYRINRAADDAASLAISEKMRAQIRGLSKGSQNVQEAISFCNVAEGALNEVHDILGRVKELAVQAASDTYVLEDREAIEAEFTQLKDEINRISKTTEYNTMRIFDDGRFEVEFTDDVCPIKIFNATNGNPGDPNTYGGIIVGEDERIAWKTIDPTMVTVDPDTGETVFKAGEYKYETKYYDFTITCEDGSKPPEIKVEFEVSASSEGIHIAGDTILWEDVVNDNDECILDHLGEEGNYHFRGRSSNGGLYVEEGALLSDIIKELNRYNEDTHRRYYSVYNGYKEEQAVTVNECASKVQITQYGYDSYIKNGTVLDTQVKVQADEDAIWLVDKDGTELRDSRKTWEELKLANWDSTNDVSDTKVYTYSYDSTTSEDDPIEVKLEFSFLLLDETSKQSVIDGLNDMDLQEGRYIASNETTVNVTTGGNIVSAVVKKNNNLLTVEEEGMLGRDFADQTDEFVTDAVAQLDTQDNKYKVVLGNSPDTLTYSLTSSTTANTLHSLVSTASIKYVEAKAVRELLGGASASTSYTLEDKIGTCSDTLSEVLKFDDQSMAATGSLVKDEEYAATSLDFSGLGQSFELKDLLGTGFSFTDASGSKNYNVMFTYGESANTVNGFGYSAYRNPSTVCVDLQTFMENGVSDGAAFADALRQIMDASGFDNGNMQYVTDDSGKLYLCDERTSYVGAGKGSLVLEPVAEAEVGITTRLSNGGRYVDTYYRYNLMNVMTGEAKMEEDADGDFIDNNGQWELYDASNYYDADGNLLPGAVLPTRYKISSEVEWESAYNTMMDEFTQNTGYSIAATDYAYCDCTVYENPNKAYASTFRFQTEEEKDEGMWIQAGPNKYQGLFLNWEGFSSHYLGLSYLSMTNREEAGTLLRRVDNAIEKISGIRSAFGAYTNRLEKAYNMNENYRENVQAAESKLRDADMATEVMANAKAEILQQVAQSMLSQANQSSQGILSLLQG